MKKDISIMRLLSIMLLFCIFMMLSCKKNKPNEMAFLTMVHNIDYPVSNQFTENELKRSLRLKVDSLKSNGIQTLIFQVRPHAGTFYKGKYEQQSPFLSESAIEIDLLENTVKLCKKNKMQLYAWINPFRVTTGEQDACLAKPFIENHPDWLFQDDKKYYLNPGVPAVRQYIVTIVREIIDNYEVDAVLFDDYFYPPSGSIDDAKTYSTYNKSLVDIKRWRRGNVSSLIKACHYGCREKKVKFIVSPVGIWRNSRDDERGTPTKGLSAYDDLYADTKLWCDSGFVDMIIPQLYFKQGQEYADFETIARWWQQNKGKAELGFALAPFKIFDRDWNPEEIVNQKRFLIEELACENIAYYNTSCFLKYVNINL